MTMYLIIALGVIFIFSYIRFKRKYRINKLFALFMAEKCRLDDSDLDSRLCLCSAYTDVQLYRKAYDEYQKILSTAELKQKLTREQIEQVSVNIRFCDAPLFWSSGPKDHMIFKYAHYFFLNRIGRRRYNFVTEKDGLEFNSFLRMRRGY